MGEHGWMGDTSAGPWGPDDGPDYDDEPSCPHCGYQMAWADCHMIDCEGGQYDLYEEDCINYDPGTYAKCEECDGEGGRWYCPNKDCPPTSTEGRNG